MLHFTFVKLQCALDCTAAVIILISSLLQETVSLISLHVKKNHSVFPHQTSQHSKRSLINRCMLLAGVVCDMLPMTACHIVCRVLCLCVSMYGGQQTGSRSCCLCLAIFSPLLCILFLCLGTDRILHN